MIFVIGIHVFAFTYFLTHTALQFGGRLPRGVRADAGRRALAVVARINLPLVAPAITGGALLAAMDSLALFGPQAILGTPAQITFLPTRIYGAIGSYPPRWGEASALSLVLVVLTVARPAVQRGYLERRSYITVGGRGVRTRAHRPRRLALAAARLLRVRGLLQRRCAHRRADADAVHQELDRTRSPPRNFTLEHFKSRCSRTRSPSAASSTASSSPRRRPPSPS